MTERATRRSTRRACHPPGVHHPWRCRRWGGLALAPTLLGAGQALRGRRAAQEAGGKLSVLELAAVHGQEVETKQFEDETGIDLKYSEALNDNNEFFAKYQEQLVA